MKQKKQNHLLFLHGNVLLLWLLAMFITIKAEAKENGIRIADSLNERAEFYFHKDFSEAQKLALAAQQISISADYEPGLAKAVSITGMVYANTNKCKDAFDILYRTLKNVSAVSSLALLHSAMGVCWFHYGNYDSARIHHERALQLYPAEEYAHQRANVLLQLGKVYIKTGNQTKALLHYQQAIAILNMQKDTSSLAWADDLLGEIYYAQRLYEKSLDYFNSAWQTFAYQANRRGAGSSLLHKGNAFYMLMKDDSAGLCYQMALKEFTALGDNNGMAIAYSNLSRVMLESGKKQEAIVYAEKALSTIIPGNYITIEAGTYQQLGDIYGELGAYTKAVVYVQKALAAARASDNKVIAKDSYKSLSELYQAMGKPALAMQNLLAAYRLKDSIQPVAFTHQLADMEAKYETEKKQAQIKLLQQQEQISKLKLQQQENKLKRQRYLLLLSAILIVSIIVALYFYMSRRRLQEQIRQKDAIRETEEKERMRIAKDIHDELGSGLSKIRFLSELAVAQTDTRVHNSLHSISDTSRGLVENMRDLVWAMNPENTTLDNLVARIREYSHDYLEEFPIEVVFDFPDDVPNSRITREASRNVHMIVKEALQNIVKHAAATKVFIKISLSPHFRLQINDDGKGYELTAVTEGNGLKNMAARSNTLDAVLSMTSTPDKGSQLVLEFSVGPEE